jgi:hypothetical protein
MERGFDRREVFRVARHAVASDEMIEQRAHRRR